MIVLVPAPTRVDASGRVGKARSLTPGCSDTPVHLGTTPHYHSK